MEQEEPIKSVENGRNPDGTFAEGNPGGPGRPKQKTFAEYFTETEIEDLVKAVKSVAKDKTDVMKMTVEQIFGKARQPLDHSGEITEKIELILSEGDERETEEGGE